VLSTYIIGIRWGKLASENGFFEVGKWKLGFGSGSQYGKWILGLEDGIILTSNIYFQHLYLPAPHGG